MSLIGKQIGSYQIKAKLGEGGMGAVYLGEHPLIGKRVAVKVLLEELASKEDIVTRFFNEAKAVNDIGHENIVDVLDFGKAKNDAGGADIVYFIMEYLDGESLASRLRRTGLAFNETLHVMEQCCSALAASHAKGIVHRDLKPENLYLCTRGGDKSFAKILDFGIAKLTGDGGTSSSKTRTGLVIGTPTYMSPEQCEGKGLIDARSDIYSLGVVMYELLTGRVPFPGEGFGEILVAHLTKEPDPPSSLNPDITPELEAVVMHAIEKDRNRRFQTMEEFGAAVSDAASHFTSYKKLPSYTGTTTRAAVNAQGAAVTGQGPTTSAGPRPTTLSGSAAQVGDVPATKSKAPLFLGIGVMALAAVIAVVVLAGKKPTNTSTGGGTTTASSGGGTAGAGTNGTATGGTTTGTAVPPPVTTPKEDPKPQVVKVNIMSEPAGAEVVRAGKVLGVTPWTIEAKKGDPKFDVEVRKEGFEAQPRTVSTDESQELFFPLKAISVVVKKTEHKKTGKTQSGGKPPAGSDLDILKPNF